MFFIIFISCILIFVLYYIGAILFLRRGLATLVSVPLQNAQSELSFSIIIAAHNEADNIARCLDSVMQQTIDTSRFEVVVVSDRSTDQTEQIVQSYISRFPNISLVRIDQTPPGYSPKKYALTKAIATSRHKILVITDADCTVKPTWLAAIDNAFSPDVGLVQGVTTYQKPIGMSALFFGLQAIDFLSHGIIAAAAIGAGMPINSNANNFAIRRKIFDLVGGYESVHGVISGDDDLLLQRVSGLHTQKIRFMTDPLGAVATLPSLTFGALIEQRKRWGSKTVYYSMQQRAFLAGIFGFYCSICMSILAGVFSPRLWLLTIALLILKTLGELILMVPGTKLFCQEQLRPYIVPASMLQLPVVLFAVVAGVFGRFSWKGIRYARSAQ